MGWWKSDPVPKVNITLSLSIFSIIRNHSLFLCSNCWILLKINITFSLSIQCTLNMLNVDDSYPFLCAVIVELCLRSTLLFICQSTLYMLNALYMYNYHLCVLLKLVMPKINVTFSMYSASSLKAGRTFVKIISFASSSSFSLKIFQISSFFLILLSYH